MKRKLNEHDVPEEVTEASQEEVKPVTTKATADFASLGLDPRLLQAVTKEKFSAPTPVQAQAIPLALAGKDILGMSDQRCTAYHRNTTNSNEARAKTGSGKTAAYVLPILQSILKRKADSRSTQSISALILVPTKELASQVTKTIASFSAFCAQQIRTENLTRKEDDKVQRARLVDVPDIIVATPSRANTLVNASVLELDELLHLVIDEADLVLSYGHDEDLQSLSKAIPQGVQTILMSATLRTEVEDLKKLFCQDPAILELDQKEDDNTKLNQYVVKCAEEEKFLLIYAIFVLKLVKGKCIIFVADTDRCYRLKLFLEQFAIKSCVLNSELPVNSRIHVVEEYNRGVYDIIIASDENEVVGSEEGSGKRRKKAKEVDDDDDEDAAADEEDKPEDAATGTKTEPAKKKRKRSRQDAEYGVSRGIDFKNVACVVNFDLPTTSKSYTHRIGRTARAGKTGMALSFVIPQTLYRKHKPTTVPTTANDEEVLDRITKHQEKKGHAVQPYDFDMKRLDGFRYRMTDALRSVTKIAVREARAKELRQELLKSEKLKRHFEENPEELRHLRHDQESHAVRVQPHLKHVPEYLVPGGKAAATPGMVGFGKLSENRIRRARMQNRLKGKGKGRKTNARRDPLKLGSKKH